MGINLFIVLPARTYKLPQELAIDMFHRIQPESISPRRLCDSFVGVGKAPGRIMQTNL